MSVGCGRVNVFVNLINSNHAYDCTVYCLNEGVNLQLAIYIINNINALLL